MDSSTDPTARQLHRSPPVERPHGKFPGWWVVTGCFLILTTTSGLAFYGLAVYLNAFSNEKGWPLGSISLATTVFFISSGVVGVWVGRLIDRFDVRLILVAGGLIGGAALAVLGRVDAQWQLYLVYAVYGAGFAAAGLVPVTTIVARWFHTNRSVALSVASSGLSVGGIVLTPFAKRLLDTRGLAGGTPWLGLLFVVGTLPFAWLLVHPDPEREGWAPDGARRAVGERVPQLTGTPFDSAVRTRFFRAVAIGYVLVLGAQVGGIQQLVKLVEDRTTAGTAAFAITAVATTSMVARLVGGRMVKRFAMMRFTVALAVVQGMAILVLGQAESGWLIFLAAFVFGATIGNVLMLQPLLLAERFGVLDYPRLFGRAQLIVVVGTAGGPLLIGALYDAVGSYRFPYAVAAACSITGAIVLSIGGPATVATDVEDR